MFMFVFVFVSIFEFVFAFEFEFEFPWPFEFQFPLPVLGGYLGPGPCVGALGGVARYDEGGCGRSLYTAQSKKKPLEPPYTERSSQIRIGTKI